MGSVATWATRGATPAPCAPCASGTSRANVPSGSVAKKGGEVGGQRGRAALVGDRWSHEVGRKGQAYTSRKRVRPSLASASPRGDRAHAFSAGSQHVDGAVSAFEPLRPASPTWPTASWKGRQGSKEYPPAPPRADPSFFFFAFSAWWGKRVFTSVRCCTTNMCIGNESDVPGVPLGVGGEIDEGRSKMEWSVDWFAF